MSTILVSGHINIETTLRVDGFPIHYYPVHYPFYGVNMSVSGVGYNIAKALTHLGNQVRFLSIIGRDLAEYQIRSELAADHIQDSWVLSAIDQTSRSVILYDGTGRRQIHVDLKDLQQQVYPAEIFEQAIETCDLAVLCNINYTRPMLDRAHQAGKIIATDVHTIQDLNDPHNRDYMRTADILFMSDEALPVPPEDWARQISHVYGTEIIIIGLGSKGALLSVRRDHFLERIPAVQTRPVVNTIGAGDALFSAFIHEYAKTRDPYQSIRKAVVFASYKIGCTGAAEGFLTDTELEKMTQDIFA